MSRITLSGFIVVPEADLQQVEAELAEHIRLTRSEPGCISFEVVQSASDPHRFDVSEEFRDREAFEAHQRRIKQSHWGRITSNVARHYQISEQDSSQ